MLKVTQEVEQLASQYSKAIQIPEKAIVDALHLAIATYYEMQYLVTWNCKHIANARVRRVLEDINRQQGIATPTICTPEEFMEV